MNDCVGALKHDQERLCETAFDQCWHLSLVLYALHAPLDLKTCSLLEECVSVELLTANPGSQAKPQRKKSVGECCCYLSREAHTTGRMQVHSAQTPARLRRTHTHTCNLHIVRLLWQHESVAIFPASGTTAKTPKLKSHRNQVLGLDVPRLSSLASSSFTQSCKVKLRGTGREGGRAFDVKCSPAGCICQF